jgi:chromosome segregation ATPase
MDGQWMTFRQAAEVMNISVRAAEARARRGRWAKRTANDGSLQVEVPLAALEDVRSPEQAAAAELARITAERDAVRAELVEERERRAKAEGQVEGLRVAVAEHAEAMRRTATELAEVRVRITAAEAETAAVRGLFAVASHERDALRAAETERAAWSWRRRMMWAVRGR